MPRVTNRLSARFAQTTTAAGRHADGAGLYLVVDDSGARRWALVFQWRGARKEMGLGSAQTVTLAKAREAARAAREQVAAGVNPVEARRAERLKEAAVTFGRAADDLMATLEPTWKNPGHKAAWRLSLETYAKLMRARPVAEVATEDVLDVLKPIWTRVPETARRTRGRIERVLDVAKARGLRSGENPARWRGHLSILLPKLTRAAAAHHAALPYPDAAAFMVELRQREALAARALELAILTASRTREVLGALWSEFDLVAAVWTVPGERMKGGREHRVALSLGALELLERLGRESPFLFPGPSMEKPLSNMAMATVLRRMERREITVHGFRSTFKDWAEDCTAYPDEMSEEALSHLVGNNVRRAYRRGDGLERRRALMEAWAEFLARPEAANVVQLRR